ncbi:MAG: Rnase Y domain-containing protein [Phycisphaerae bacterium]
MMLAQSSAYSWLFLLLGLILGGAGLMGYQVFLAKKKRESAEQQAAEIVKTAERQSRDIVRAAEVETKATFLARQEAFEKEAAETRNEIREAEKRLDKREDQLDRKLDMLGIKERNIDKAEAKVREKTAEIEAKSREIDDLLVQERNQLLKTARLSMDDAKQQLFRRLENELEHECAEIVSREVNAAQEEAEQRSREVVITAIQRFAAGHDRARGPEYPGLREGDRGGRDRG